MVTPIDGWVAHTLPPPPAAPPGFTAPAQAAARHGITILAPLTQPWACFHSPASGRRLHVAG